MAVPSHDEARAQALARQLNGPLLALETATSVSSVCLVTQERCSLKSMPAAMLPSDGLVSTIVDLLGEFGLDVRALRALVVSLGPGSFTGLRVGLATAKGLALGGGVPLYGVSSLATWAASAGSGLRLSVVDARRGEVFGGLFDVQQGIAAPRIGDETTSLSRLVQAVRPHLGAEPLTCVGDQAGAAADLIDTATVSAVMPSALCALLQASSAIFLGSPPPLASLVPRYLRVSEAERQAGLPDL